MMIHALLWGYKNVYEKLSFHVFKHDAIVVLNIVAYKHGGNLFNLKEILGDCILENQDCDKIMNLSVTEFCSHNMSMRKRMATQAKLPTIPVSE